MVFCRFNFSTSSSVGVGESHATPATQIVCPDPCVALLVHSDTFLLRYSFDSFRYISLPVAALIISNSVVVSLFHSWGADLAFSGGGVCFH